MSPPSIAQLFSLLEVHTDPEILELGEDPDDGLGDEDADGESDDELGDEQESHPNTEEELTLYLKPREEREEIEEEIADLEATVPQLSPDYKIVDTQRLIPSTPRLWY